VVGEAGKRVMEFYGRATPEVRRWKDPFAIVLAERAWMNFSVFFRLMDRLGLPRTFVTESVGGASEGPEDERFIWPRLFAALPCLLRLQLINLIIVLNTVRELRRLDAEIAAARDLKALYSANVSAMSMAIRTNFAINSMLTGVARLRKRIGIRGTARIATRAMMEEYSALGALTDTIMRNAHLDAWISRYGHRGPLECDPARPRFAELRDVLQMDIEHQAHKQFDVQEQANEVSASSEIRYTTSEVRMAKSTKLFFFFDERREWFRDQLMLRWSHIRTGMLAVGSALVQSGQLTAVDDIFYLRAEDLAGDTLLRNSADQGRTRIAAAVKMSVPLTATTDMIREIVQTNACVDPERTGVLTFRGISLTPIPFEGRAVLAMDLLVLLREAQNTPGLLRQDVILVTPTLEPAWAIVFSRVGAVVTEVGNELSHTSILLREARRPAIINCIGIMNAVRTGDRLRLDGRIGTVEIVMRQ
jgi:phosphohistidine swiveling domain-containing protein